MKEDFLTIPDAPNYEINSELIMRNKTTGHLLKMLPKPGRKSMRYILFVNGKQVSRRPETWRHQAEMALSPYEWLPIPSTGDKYEMTKYGTVRNSATKRILNLGYDGLYHFWVDGKSYIRSRDSLLYEVTGNEKFNHDLPVPVMLTQGRRSHYFDSLTAAAKFLSGVLPITWGGVRAFFKKRRREIYGWTVKYMNDIEDNYQRELNGLARRQRRAVI